MAGDTGIDPAGEVRPKSWTGSIQATADRVLYATGLSPPSFILIRSWL
jgi:hypothetical protein